MSSFEKRVSVIKELIEVNQLLDVFGLNTSEIINGEIRLICPLPGHNDKDPSFCFNVYKKLFNCFGCNQQGDMISFVMKMKKCSFQDALVFLETLIMGGSDKQIEITDRVVKRNILESMIKRAKIRVDKLIYQMEYFEPKEYIKLCFYVDLIFTYYVDKVKTTPDEDLKNLQKNFLAFFRILLSKYFLYTY